MHKVIFEWDSALSLFVTVAMLGAVFGTIFSSNALGSNREFNSQPILKSIREVIKPIGNETFKSLPTDSRPDLVNQDSLIVHPDSLKALLVNPTILKSFINSNTLRTYSGIKSQSTNTNSSFLNNNGVQNPQTSITSALDCNNAVVANRSTTAFSCITFGFVGTPSTQVLDCRLDNGPFQPCIIDSKDNLPFVGYSSGSITYTDLNPGTHSFRVYAIAGDPLTSGRLLRDPVPIVYSWTVNPLLRIPDSSGDGITDNWKQNGIDINNDGIIDFDLRSHGATPMHKDIFVELDYMQNHRPFDISVNDVERAFANAPVQNPDGNPGINLHIEIDEQVPSQPTLTFPDEQRWPAFDDIKDIKGCLSPSGAQVGCWGTPRERADPNAINILAAKRLAYHYALFINTYGICEPERCIPEDTSSSGLAEIFGNDFIVSLGDPSFGTDPATGLHVGTEDEQSGAIMHELGHNLGLHHGGFEDTPNCKPNYFSVMSYAREFTILSPRPLDYSRSLSPPLDENNHSESIGIQGPPGETAWYGPPVTWPHPQFDHVEENGLAPRITETNQTTDFSVVSAGPLGASPTGDVNTPDTGTSDLDGTTDLASDLDNLGFDPCTGDSTLVMLNSFNDWSNLQYNFRQSSAFPEGTHGGSPGVSPSLASHASTPSLAVASGPPHYVQSSSSGPEFNGKSIIATRILLFNSLESRIMNLTADLPRPPGPNATSIEAKFIGMLLGSNNTSIHTPLENSSLVFLLQNGKLDLAIQRLNDLTLLAKSSLGAEKQGLLLPEIKNFIAVLQKQK